MKREFFFIMKLSFSKVGFEFKKQSYKKVFLEESKHMYVK